VLRLEGGKEEKSEGGKSYPRGRRGEKRVCFLGEGGKSRKGGKVNKKKVAEDKGKVVAYLTGRKGGEGEACLGGGVYCIAISQERERKRSTE